MFSFVNAAISMRNPSLVVSTTELAPTGSTLTHPSGAIPATEPTPSAIFTTSVSITGMRGLGSVNCTGKAVEPGDPLSTPAATVVVGATVRSGARGTNAVVSGEAAVVVVVLRARGTTVVVVVATGAIVVVVVVVVLVVATGAMVVVVVVVVIVGVGNVVVVVVVGSGSPEPPPPEGATVVVGDGTVAVVVNDIASFPAVSCIAELEVAEFGEGAV